MQKLTEIKEYYKMQLQLILLLLAQLHQVSRSVILMYFLKYSDAQTNSY